MTSILEQKIGREFADLGVKPYVYHIRSYGEGYQRRILGSVNAITIADVGYQTTANIEHDVGEVMEGLANARMSYGSSINPATWVMYELRGFEYYGVAICDNRDNFSRKRGRIIAKGRLLKYLRSRPAMIIDAREIDQKVVAEGPKLMVQSGEVTPKGL